MSATNIWYYSKSWGKKNLDQTDPALLLSGVIRNKIKYEKKIELEKVSECTYDLFKKDSSEGYKPTSSKKALNVYDLKLKILLLLLNGKNLLSR